MMIGCLIVIAVGVVALAHMAPAPFLLDVIAGRRAVWHMPRGHPPTIYLTYDDGPNPTTTPDLLDVLAREGVRATFFVIDEHLTAETAPIVRRMFADGHAVALHSPRKRDLLKSSAAIEQMLTAAADRIETLCGSRPCRAFRPRGGWRSAAMFAALRRMDYLFVGFSWRMWDVDPLRARTADRILARLLPRAESGDIIVVHDGDDGAPRADQRHAVEATARLIPALRARGFGFTRIL